MTAPPAAPTTDPAAVVTRDLRAVISRLHRRLREVATSDGLTPSQVAALTRIGKREASSASALAALEGVRPQSMAATLATLEERGLVRRDADPEDGRRQLLSLTETGRSTFDGERQARREWLADAVRTHADDDELRVLARAVAILERVLA
ncbi:MarR family transcriptional regulator [Xylanimonas protaetiae]|uniref:MarR family transcriptional regulator n=1 Tax=Xylanimonas protaetiae TaxID=2509457 RepID=A0A4P6F6V4_9MICO|nr:MarR family transcriptional regulator [Xylanimonas protaetiae]